MTDVLEFWIQLHSHPEIEISFKFIPKILMSKECIHFIGPLCIHTVTLQATLKREWQKQEMAVFSKNSDLRFLSSELGCNPAG